MTARNDGSLSFFSDDERIIALEYEELKAKSVRDQEQIEFLSDEVRWLKEQLRALKREKFGKKSERWESPEQLVFNEAEIESLKPDLSGDEDVGQSTTTTVESHTRKRRRGHRRPLPEELPREIIKIELPIEEQVSADGMPLKIIGWELSEKLKYEPAKMSVIQYHRAKYGVECGDFSRTAPPLPSIIPRGIATAELLSAIVVGKYADSLPLYRMEEIFLRHGIDLTRGTMSRWVMTLAEALQPIWNVLSDRLLSSFYVACDETHVQVLKEKGRSAESKSWMWVRSTPFGSKKIVLFDYNPSRSGEIAKELFADFKGVLQTDGLSSYNSIEGEGVLRIGCNMHGRRRFEKAVVTGAKEGKSLGETGLKFYKRLYDIEDEIKAKPPDERKRLRDELAKPIWDEFKLWVDEKKTKVPKKSKIGDAFSYFESQYDSLTGYLTDGRLNCDNGFTERAIRKFAIGRNNWIFSDTEHGANASALLYSLVVTAKVNGVNPYRALVKMFDELPRASSIDDYERLAEFILSPDASA